MKFRDLLKRFQRPTLFLFGQTLLCLSIAVISLRSNIFLVFPSTRPFELGILAVFVITLFDVIKNNKWQLVGDFISQTYFRISLLLVTTVIIGWVISLVSVGIPYSVNSLLEFGAFGVSLVSMILVGWYIFCDEFTLKAVFYSILVPTLFIVFIILPHQIKSLVLQSNIKFIGFTNNPNVFAKFLFAPLLFFYSYSIFKKTAVKKIVGWIISILLVTLLFWTTSRASLLAVVIAIGMIFIWYCYQNFNLKKVLTILTLSLSIAVIGFILIPYNIKQLTANRLLNSDNRQLPYNALKQESLDTIVRNSFNKTPILVSKTDGETETLLTNKSVSETRLEIWPYYIRLNALHPFGIGPNTHIENHLLSRYGTAMNTGPHNTYLQVWMWGGIAGLLSFLALIVIALVSGFRLILKNRDDTVFLALATTFLAFLFANLFDDNLGQYLFFIILGMLLQNSDTDYLKRLLYSSLCSFK